MKHSQPNGYEDIPSAPAVASPQYLLSQILDRLTALEDEVAELREEGRQKDIRISTLEEEIATLRDENAHERAFDRQRLARLEAPAPVLSQKTAENHVNRLFSEMRRLSIRQTTAKDAARLLGVTKRHINRLEPLLAADNRFQLVQDPHHKQRHLIRLV